MKVRGATLVFGSGDHEWTAPDPRARRNESWEASAYRALCFAPDGIAKLEAIRRGLKAASDAKRATGKGA